MGLQVLQIVIILSSCWLFTRTVVSIALNVMF